MKKLRIAIFGIGRIGEVHLKNRKATVTFEDCRKSLEICEKLYLSVKSGKSIKL